MLCVGTNSYDCLSTVCFTTQERCNEENVFKLLNICVYLWKKFFLEFGCFYFTIGLSAMGAKLFFIT